MKIYTDSEYKILALNAEPLYYEHCFETNSTREEMFSHWCDACIMGYKYTPNFEMLFNEDGSNQRDPETGELLYQLGESGNKKFTGYSCYPFIDYHTLMLIQKQYEDLQKQIQELSDQIQYLSLKLEMDANNY